MAYAFSNTLISASQATANVSKYGSYTAGSGDGQVNVSSSDKRSVAAYRYTVKLEYLNVAKNATTEIVNECLKSMIIDHNYEQNCMPWIICNMKLDKSLVDDMIKNQNTNFFIVTVSKYNNMGGSEVDTLCFREKC